MTTFRRSRKEEIINDVEESMGVLDLLSRRLESRSRPGRRQDQSRLVLAIEGGASRAVYSSGMALALSDAGLLPLFDAVYGTSAGAMVGALLLSSSPSTGLERWSDPSALRTIIDPLRLLRGRPIVDLESVLDAYDSVMPGVFKMVLRHEVPLHPIATSATTGMAEDLHPYIHDEHSLRRALRASSTMPLLGGRPVALAGDYWTDGGLTEDIPFRTPVRHGATHVLILRSRPVGEQPRPTPAPVTWVVQRHLRRHAPGAVGGWLVYDQDRIDREATFTGVPFLQIRPPAGSPPISRLERSTRLLAQAFAVGQSAFADALEAL